MQFVWEEGRSKDHWPCWTQIGDVSKRCPETIVPSTNAACQFNSYDQQDGMILMLFQEVSTNKRKKISLNLNAAFNVSNFCQNKASVPFVYSLWVLLYYPGSRGDRDPAAHRNQRVSYLSFYKTKWNKSNFFSFSAEVILFIFILDGNFIN